MTPNLHKNDESTLVLNRNVRRSFIGLLMALGCFLGFFQPALAGEKPTAANPTITIVKDFSVAGSGNPDIFQLTFNPAPPDGTQLQVNFGSGASLVYFVYGGVVTIPVLNPTVGTVPVTVKSQDGSIVYASVTLTFIAAPGPPDPSQSYIIAVQPSSPADGNSQDIVRAVLYDQYGNPCASGTQVNWLIQSGTATMSPSNGQTTSTGNIATTTYTSLVPGTVNVQAQIFFAGAWRFLPDLTHTNYYVPIQFTVLQPDVTKSYITGITTTTAADGTSQDEVDAVVKDNLGNNVPDGTVVTFSIKSGTATMTVSGTTVNGVVKATFTSTTVGSVDVQAQVDINGVPTYLNDNITGNNYTTIFFTDPPPDITKSSIYGVVTTTAADGTSQNEVDALVKNSLGGNVPDGTVVTFTIKSGTATIVLQTTVQNGIAKAYFTSTVVGSVDVQGQVQINGVWTYLNDRDAPANNYTTVKFTQPPPSLNSSYIVGITTTTLADGTSQNEVDAFVFSAAGPMPVGTPVTFTIKSGTATIVLQTTVQAGGIAKAYFTSTVVGAVDVQAQVDISGVPTFLNDLNAPANNYTTIHFVAGPPVPGDPGGGGTGGTPPGNG
ncbi:MAG TPA: Ig-like domain-containing protein, partial [Puia sp.]